MIDFLFDARWGAAYRRFARASFATVPLYREFWSPLSGREPGMAAAITADEAVRKLFELVPLAGGDTRLNPLRGLGPVLRRVRGLGSGGLIVVLGRDGGEPRDLPRRWRCRLLDPRLIAGTEPVLAELDDALRRGRAVLAVGADGDLVTLTEVLPASAELDRVPARRLGALGDGRSGVIHDPALGYLGALGNCGRWHLDWRRVYARRTDAGLALTLLRQRSPRLVDVLVEGAQHADIAPCQVHRTPVVVRA